MAAIVLGLGVAATASASTVGVTSEAGVANNGNLSWGVLGGDGMIIANPFTVAIPGASGMQMTVSQLANPFKRLDQGANFGGNFADGEQLLWSQGANAPMTFDFSQSISGFGAQIQANFWGPFVAVISAFDVNNQLLGSFQMNGVSNGNGDDSAIFLGLVSDALDIRRVVISVPVAATDIQDFAINAPRIQTSGAKQSSQFPAEFPVGAAEVPEPASMILLGTGLAALGTRLRRRSA